MGLRPISAKISNLSHPSPIVIPNEVKGSAVSPPSRNHSNLSHPSPLVIPTEAYPDFLLRAASEDHVCGSL